MIQKPQQLFAQLGSPESLNIPSNELDSAAVNDILGVVYFAAAVVAVIGIIVGGYFYTMSGGDSGKVTKAKNIILYSAIGIVVVALAFTITQFVIGGVQ